ncbi:MAG TPA: helix-turn-helix domain-containing protein [Longimicrobiaceae bacterium]
MQSIPSPLLVLHSDPVLISRLNSVAQQRGYELRRYHGWAELTEAARSAPASALIIVDPYEGTLDRSQIAPELARLLDELPSLAITAAMHLVPGTQEHVRRLGAMGVVQVIDLEEETTTTAVAQRLDSARGRPLRALMDRALPDSTSGAARAILAAATAIVAEGGQGQDLAEFLNVTPRTVSRWCRRAALPPPKRLLAWMRILLAAELLDDPGRRITEVAASCGYAADSSLRHTLRTFVGMTPTELRQRGAFAVSSRLFLEALAEARSADKRYRAPSAR